MREIIPIIENTFPDRKIISIKDRRYWLDDKRFQESKQRNGTGDWRGKRVYTFKLDNEEKYCLKLADPASEWENDFVSELSAYKLLKNIDVPIPEVIKIDNSHTLINTNYIIVTLLEGTKLSDLWQKTDEDGKKKIYHTLGECYKIINDIKGKKSGLFRSFENLYETRYPIHPNDFMFRNEIRGGSGRGSVEEGLLRKKTFEKIVALWKTNINYLKSHVPALVHLSAFCWTISFDIKSKWKVSKITGLGDMMWWDPGVNLALFRYPPFMEISEKHWDSFLKGYKPSVDIKRVALYGLLVQLQAYMGGYYEPNYVRYRQSRYTFEQRIEKLIDEADG